MVKEELEVEKKAKIREAQELEVQPKIEEKLEEAEEKELPVRETRKTREAREKEAQLESWVPKTELGRQVRSAKIKDINEILQRNQKILEAEIVDLLLPNLESDLIHIGQSKGKFGGGKRRPWRQTQRKTAEGNVPSFACMAVVGDRKAT